MTGPGQHTDSKLREWAQKRNGDPIGAQDVKELLFAVDADSRERHAETMGCISSLGQLLADKVDCEDFVVHCGDSGAHDHGVLHADHMERHHVLQVRRAGDPDGADFSSSRGSAADDADFNTRLVVFFAGTLGKLVIFVAGGVSLALVNYLVFGRP
jgi:hypothetical protein